MIIDSVMEARKLLDLRDWPEHVSVFFNIPVIVSFFHQFKETVSVPVENAY